MLHQEAHHHTFNIFSTWC